MKLTQYVKFAAVLNFTFLTLNKFKATIHPRSP